MSDLAKTQAQWNKFLKRELALEVSILRLLREVRDQFRFERTQVVVLDSRTGFVGTAGISLSGVDLNSNTAVGGFLYARITGAGPYTVTIYKATGGGGGDAVASGSANANATATLTASNSSGITGTWALPSSVSTTTDDTLILFPIVDYRKRARQVYDGTANRDAATMAATIDGIDSVEGLLDQAIASWRGTIRRTRTELGLSGADFMGRSYPEGLIQDSVRQGASGEVTRIRSGFLPELGEAMEDDTVAGEQDILRRVTAAAAGVFDAANTGLGAVASSTPMEHCPAGVWKFRCVAGTDTGQGGSERFDGTFKASDRDEEFPFSGLIVGQQWTGPFGLGPITLTRTLSKTNDGSNNVFAAASGAVVTGAKDANTDAGVLHVSVTANGGNWDIAFYKSSNRTAGELVAQATNIASSAAFVATEKRGSGITVSWTLGGTVSAIATITLNLNFFVTQNSDGVPDSFSITTSVSGTPGIMQEIIGDELDYSLNSDASGSESVADGYATAGTFPRFSQQDN